MEMLENMSEQKPKREYIFKGESSLEHYEAASYDVACVDDRFWKVRKNFVKSLGEKHIDPKTPAGGAMVFSSPIEESDREHHLRELGISIRLHHVKKIRLFTHHDCGAYGGFGKFNNDPDVELEFHKSEHLKATEVIHERYPDLIVETYFIDDVGIVKTS